MKYTDIFELFINMAEFILNNKLCQIYCADNPAKMTLGWIIQCDNKEYIFEIRLHDLKTSSVNSPYLHFFNYNENSKLINEIFYSKSLRENVPNILNKLNINSQSLEKFKKFCAFI